MCSRPPHNCKTVISQREKDENDSEMCKNENCWCKPCKTTVFIVKCRKIPKVSPAAYIFQRSFLRETSLEGLILGENLQTEENLRYKFDLASLWLGGNLCVIALFVLCFILYFRAVSK